MEYQFPVQQGWQCPICGKVLAPWMSECPCNGMGPATITTTGTGSKPEDQEVIVTCKNCCKSDISRDPDGRIVCMDRNNSNYGMFRTPDDTCRYAISNTVNKD